MKLQQQGFTLYELLFVGLFVAAVAAAGFGLYVVYHFISKFW